MTTTTQSNEKAAPAVQLPVDLRDYFAAKAMQSLTTVADCFSNDFRHEAAAAYRIADAMLAERAK